MPYIPRQNLTQEAPRVSSFELLRKIEEFILPMLAGARLSNMLFQTQRIPHANAAVSARDSEFAGNRLLNFQRDIAHLHLRLLPNGPGEDPVLVSTVDVQSIRNRDGGAAFRCYLCNLPEKKEQALLVVVENQTRLTIIAYDVAQKLARLLGVEEAEATTDNAPEGSVTDEESIDPAELAAILDTSAGSGNSTGADIGEGEPGESDVPTVDDRNALLSEMGVTPTAEGEDAAPDEEAADGAEPAESAGGTTGESEAIDSEAEAGPGDAVAETGAAPQADEPAAAPDAGSQALNPEEAQAEAHAPAEGGETEPQSGAGAGETTPDSGDTAHGPAAVDEDAPAEEMPEAGDGPDSSES